MLLLLCLMFVVEPCWSSSHSACLYGNFTAPQLETLFTKAHPYLAPGAVCVRRGAADQCVPLACAARRRELVCIYVCTSWWRLQTTEHSACRAASGFSQSESKWVFFFSCCQVNASSILRATYFAIYIAGSIYTSIVHRAISLINISYLQTRC